MRAALLLLATALACQASELACPWLNSATAESILNGAVTVWSEPAREGHGAMRGRSPDQFRLSRLKEGDCVCGGLGQFGNQPLWDLNTILNLRKEQGTV